MHQTKFREFFKLKQRKQQIEKYKYKKKLNVFFRKLRVSSNITKKAKVFLIYGKVKHLIVIFTMCNTCNC